MIRLAFEMGLRRGEVVQIHSDDILDDLWGKSLMVRGKGGKTRVVPIPDSLVPEIMSYPRGWLFPGNIDGHVSPLWAAELVRETLPPDKTMHSLRHGFATRAYLESGGDLLLVQELLGHASPETTLRYIFRDSRHKRDLLNKMADHNTHSSIS